MNLYDLSIGEDKMNQFLSIALKTHFESLKVSGKGENYWQCYQAFLNYCDIYGDCDLKDLFNNKLLRFSENLRSNKLLYYIVIYGLNYHLERNNIADKETYFLKPLRQNTLCPSNRP